MKNDIKRNFNIISALLITMMLIAIFIIVLLIVMKSHYLPTTAVADI